MSIINNLGQLASQLVIASTDNVQKRLNLKEKLTSIHVFTSVGTTRRQGIIRVVVVATFSLHSHFLEDFKVNEAQY